MAGIDTNRTTTGIYLPPEISGEIWQKVQEESLVQRIANQIDLPGSGVSVDIITGDPEPEWVSETGVKKIGRGTFDNKQITPYNMALIVPFSNQFRRDKNALFNAFTRRLPRLLAQKFDRTVLFGDAPGSNFDTLKDVQTQSITAGANNAAYKGYTGALEKVVNAEGDVTAWVLSPAGEINNLNQLGADDKPVFISNPTTEGSIGSILARPVYKSKAAHKPGQASGPAIAKTLGFAGDWSEAYWGTVEGIQYDESDKVTLEDGVVTIEVGDDTIEIPNYVNTWQRNMFAVRIEVEFGFRFRDANKYVRLTGANAA